MLRKSLIASILIVLFIIHTTPIWGSMKLNSHNLEVNGEVLGEAVTEEEMDGKRGTFMGFYFSVLFEGYWDTLGNYQASLLTNTNASSAAPPDLTSTLPAGTQVNIQATVGGMGNSQGIFQITQVPGSGNIVTNNLIINIQVLQTLGNTLQNLPNFWK
jgi:hypothetical protein